MKLYELFIGWRYLKSKKGKGSISSNTFLSIVIVFIGVFVLIVVLSVMNGFQAAIKDKILDVDSHITIAPMFSTAQNTGFRRYRSLMKRISGINEVRSVDPFIMSQGLFRVRSEILPVLIRGIGGAKGIPMDVKKFIRQLKNDESPRREGYTDIPQEVENDFLRNPTVFIGEEMALTNQIDIGKYIQIIVPKGRLVATEGMTPGIERFRVIGYFKTGYYEYDKGLIIMSVPQAQRLFDIGDSVTGVGIKIHDVYGMERVAEQLRMDLGFDYSILTAEQRHGNLFYALRLEKLIMAIILILIIISAGFTIMGTLVMVVMEKRKAVGILKSMGAGPNSIMVIFILEGFFIGIIGSLLGVFLGVVFSLNLDAIIHWLEDIINSIGEWAFRAFDLGFWNEVLLIPDQVYYIEGLPTQVQPELVTVIAAAAVFICTAAAILPAWNASRLRPVETIRYE